MTIGSVQQVARALYRSFMSTPVFRREVAVVMLLALLAGVSIGCAGATVFVAADPPTASAFVPYHSAAGRFTVQVPGVFDETVKTTNNPYLGPIEVHYFVLAPDGGPRYAVVYGDFPASYVTSTPLDVIYRESRDGNVGQGRLVESGPRTVAGRAADEHVVDGATGLQRFVSVLVGNRLYGLAVRGTDGQIHSADADRFIASFAVDPG